MEVALCLPSLQPVFEAWHTRESAPIIPRVIIVSAHEQGCTAYASTGMHARSTVDVGATPFLVYRIQRSGEQMDVVVVFDTFSLQAPCTEPLRLLLSVIAGSFRKHRSHSASNGLESFNSKMKNCFDVTQRHWRVSCQVEIRRPTDKQHVEQDALPWCNKVIDGL